jgi:hypothetical protein
LLVDYDSSRGDSTTANFAIVVPICSADIGGASLLNWTVSFDLTVMSLDSLSNPDLIFFFFFFLSPTDAMTLGRPVVNPPNSTAPTVSHYSVKLNSPAITDTIGISFQTLFSSGSTSLWSGTLLFNNITLTAP